MQVRYLVLVMMLMGIGAAAAGQAPEQYFAVFMDGHKVGYESSIRQVEKTKVTTTEAIDLTLSRNDISVRLTQKQTSFETADGKPLGFESFSDLGMMQQVVKGTIDPNGKVTLKIGTGAATQTQSMDWPQGAVMSEGLRLLQAATGLKAGSVVDAIMFDPESMTPIKMRMKIGTKEKVDLLGRVAMLTKVETLMETTGGSFSAIDYIDNEMVSQKRSTSIMGMNLEFVACDKVFALGKNDVVDFLDKAAIQSPVSLAGAESAKAVRYKLTPLNQATLHFPATDNQTVKMGNDGEVLLTARPVGVAAGGKFPYKGSDAVTIEALKPGRYVQ
ncbi:MAG: hypothetical protein Q7T18_04460, partial [Sedimentisphaerales bacterium]|nr:hypothetical protein [Sedimentisphaerales bacterium]